MTHLEYWREAVACALDEAGLAATSEQIDIVAKSIKQSRDCEYQAFGDDVADKNWYAQQNREMEDMRIKLAMEQAKRVCPACRGTGKDVHELIAGRVSVSRCYKCGGEGKVSP